MVRLWRVGLAVCPMGHPLCRWLCARRRHGEGNGLKDQAYGKRLGASPLNSGECEIYFQFSTSNGRFWVGFLIAALQLRIVALPPMSFVSIWAVSASPASRAPEIFLLPPPAYVIAPVTITGPYQEKPPFTSRSPSTSRMPQPCVPPASLSDVPCIL